MATGHLRPGSSAVITRTGVAATDGAQVNSEVVPIHAGDELVAELELTVNGGPATFDARTSVEMSADGTNWHEVVRFADHTNAAAHAKQVARIGAGVAGSIADQAAAALGGASAGGAIKDGSVAGFLRMVTKLQTLTGGAAPSVDFKVRLAVG
jgi:hypothetical protein